MTDDEIDELFNIFSRERPHGYTLTLEKPEDKRLFGSCNYINHEIYLYGVNVHDLKRMKLTLLHEIAHGNAAEGHTYKWVQEFIRLLEKYKIPKVYVAESMELGPNLFKWVQS